MANNRDIHTNTSNKLDVHRYSRNIMLPQIGEEGQRSIINTSVLIVGCGALGSICSMYLASSGIGRLGLVDFDTIDISNLQRQISYQTSDVGKRKTQVLRERLNSINPHIDIEVFDLFLNKQNVKEIFDKYDLIVEGSDNPDTKYLVSDTCGAISKPYSMGGIRGVEGQVHTFTPGHAIYRDFFPLASPAGSYTPCALGGVLGPLAGIIGSIQAVEVLKLAAKFGEPLVDRMLLVDGPSLSFTEVFI